MKHLKNESGIASIVLIIGIVMIIIYLASFSFAYRGWGYYGYYGYYGYNRGPSWYYWHGGDIYPNSPTMRTGGVNSPRHSSKGMRGGK